MKSLLNPELKAEVLKRAAQLKADTPRKWGTMNSGQMLNHLSDAFALAMGETQAKPQGNFLTHTLGKWLFFYVFPWPKGLPTAPEMLQTPSENFDADMRRFLDTIERFYARGENAQWAPSPIFGPLNGKESGFLAYKHINHHFNQFGV